ncbi:hypothetical protein, partial [Methylobacterium soli]|uniref:hypothetical protein n=1 Tax=Methylobacterium soli TaxID=553447 RepID=UPI001AEFAF87
RQVRKDISRPRFSFSSQLVKEPHLHQKSASTSRDKNNTQPELNFVRDSLGKIVEAARLCSGTASGGVV